MRALITGIKGFTGHYAATSLRDAGWEVVGIGAQPGNGEADYRQVDLGDAQGLRAAVTAFRPDAVLHLAAIAFVGHGDPEAFYRVNLIGTRQLLAALAGADRVPDSVVLASSANVYGNATEGMLAETAPPDPVNDYAVSKLAMEQMARLWRDRLPLTIVRPFNYTGVGQSQQFLLPKIVAHFRRRAARIELGNLDVWRDFSDVRAVADAYRRLIELRPAGQTLNLCSGRMHSLREAIAMAEGITGHRMEVDVNPAFVRASEVRRLCGDPARLRALLPDWDTPPLEQTLRWMLEAPAE